MKYHFIATAKLRVGLTYTERLADAAGPQKTPAREPEMLLLPAADAA